MADPSGEFTKALELDFDSVAIFGNRRSKRYALVVEDGKVKSVHAEPDNTGTNGEKLLPILLCVLIISNPLTYDSLPGGECSWLSPTGLRLDTTSAAP